MKQIPLDLPLPEGWMYIFRSSFTTVTGWTVYAKEYGKRAFRIPVKVEGNRNQNNPST